MINSSAIHTNEWENSRDSKLIIRHIIPMDFFHQQAASPMSLISAAYRSPPVRVSGGSLIPIAHEYGDGSAEVGQAIGQVIRHESPVEA